MAASTAKQQQQKSDFPYASYSGGGRHKHLPKTGYSDVSVRYFSQDLLVMPA